MKHRRRRTGNWYRNWPACWKYSNGISREHWDQDRVLRDAVYRLLLLVYSCLGLPFRHGGYGADAWSVKPGTFLDTAMISASERPPVVA